jgi:adenylate kinase
MNKGELVSDELVNAVVENVTLNPKNFNRLIFDGYPRTLSQIYNLEKMLKKTKQKISIVLSLTVNKDIISKRINGRIVCTKCLKIFNTYFSPPNSKNHSCEKKYLQKRTDDNYKIILNRLESYLAKTKPIVDYYKKKLNFVEIDGNQNIDKIYNKIRGVLDNIRD